VFTKKKLVKTKGVEDWQQKEHLQDSFIEIIRQLQRDGAKK